MSAASGLLLGYTPLKAATDAPTQCLVAPPWRARATDGWPMVSTRLGRGLPQDHEFAAITGLLERVGPYHRTLAGSHSEAQSALGILCGTGGVVPQRLAAVHHFESAEGQWLEPDDDDELAVRRCSQGSEV